jgi:CheY-like chemotaxis protein
MIEDDLQIMKEMSERLEKNYGQFLQVLKAEDAGSALRLLRAPSGLHLPDALILDFMMKYGDARTELEESPDPDEWNTGLRLLAWLRKSEQTHGTIPIWVAIVTARSALVVDAPAKKLLGGSGKIYYKPFNDLQLEYDLIHALGIPCALPHALLNHSDSQDDGDIP